MYYVCKDLLILNVIKYKLTESKYKISCCETKTGRWESNEKKKHQGL